MNKAIKILFTVLVALGILLMLSFLLGKFQKMEPASPGPVPKKTTPVTTCPSAVDDVEGNTYSTVKLGNQCWMGENMRTTKYPDGSSITKGPSANKIAGWNTDLYYYSCPPNTSQNGEDCAAALGRRQG